MSNSELVSYKQKPYSWANFPLESENVVVFKDFIFIGGPRGLGIKGNFIVDIVCI